MIWQVQRDTEPEPEEEEVIEGEAKVIEGEAKVIEGEVDVSGEVSDAVDNETTDGDSEEAAPEE